MILFRYLCISAILLTGCSTWSSKLKTVITTPSRSKIVQTGDAKVPAKVIETDSSAEIPFVSGQIITIQQPMTIPGVTLSPSPLPVTLTSHAEKVEAATSFTPPAPPTPVQLEDAKAKGLYYLVLVIGAALGIFGLVEHWPSLMIGGGCAAVAAVTGLFIIDKPFILYIIGGCALLCFIGPYLYHTIVKPVTAVQTTIPPIK